MKKVLLLFVLLTGAVFVKAQTIYYWVGGAASANINTAANWNTALNGSGTTRPSSTGASDVLVFDGTNLGGATTVTGPITVNANASITASQLKFVNGANVSFVRNATGTSTITLVDGPGDDFIIDASSTFSITSNTGSVVIWMQTGETGTVSGVFKMLTTLQARICNTNNTAPLPPPVPATLVFTGTSSFYTNITAASAAYAFGNASQSTEQWVTFQPGAQLYYDGGYSPFGSSSAFMPVNFQPGSIWHHRVSNPTASFGTFSNNKSFANLSIENGAVFTADGPINRIDTLNVTSGSSFITHTTGATTIRGNLIVDGSLTQPATRSNTIVFAGNVPQTISGSGTLTVASLTVADNSDVTLNRNMAGLDTATNIYGKINFNNNQLQGTGTFTSRTNGSVTGIAGTLTSGSSQITAVAGTLSNILGMTVTGIGIPANTTVVNFSNAGATINLSKNVTASGTAVPLTFTSGTSTLVTSNTNGFDPATGSIAVTGIQTYQPGTSYIINGATTKPFGITTGSTATSVDVGAVTINAPVTTNTGINVSGNIQLNGAKVTIRPLDTVHLLAGATLTGTFGASNYFVTGVNSTTGAQGIFRVDGIAASKLLPVGSANNYMPATINPTSVSDFAVAVFEGITANGLPTGAPLTATQKQTKVDAVWNINRVNGSGNANLQLQWAQALEGSTFTTLTNSDIGVIVNNGSSWALPTTPGDNTANIASASFNTFGAFGVGAQPPAQAFVFNPLPVKTYGDPDFNGGAISANTTQPIVYTSSNPAVATIVAGNIHVVGVGNSNITASQATDGFYPAVSVTQPLTVGKAPLTIKADDKSKPQGDPNPVLTVTYTGFVLGETSAVLTTPVTITTTATTASAPGTYPITPSAATAANYNISFVNGTMTVTPRQNQTITFNALPTKTYGNADFPAGATSSNTTIPITYTSSNTAVATIVGNNIHIVGAGTADIKASQAGNAFYFPAADVTRTLTVNKANLTVRALDTSKTTGQVNPPFNIVYTGFVLGENPSVLTAQPSPITVATTTTPPGVYPIDLSSGVSNNYNFIYTSGKFTIYPTSGTTVPYIQAYMSSPAVLTVKLYSPTPDLGDVILYDLTGKVVMTKNVFMPQGFLSYTFNVQVPASGIYVIKAVGSHLELKTTVPIIK